MVYLKVSDGSETRKLQVTPGEITFDQLKQQLATFFPKALGEASSDLSLQYRDTDGDVITLSSDQELQEALSQLKEDGVWKLYIRAGKGTQKPAPSSSAQRTQRRNHCERRSLFHHLFEPNVKPFGLFSDVWDDLEQHLQLLHHLHSEVFSSNANKTDTKNGTEKSTSESASKSEEEPAASSSSTEQAEDPDEVVKSKPQADGSERKPENSGGDSSNNGWQTKRFVTWEPRLHVGPFGFFHSHLTPVVYNVAYRSSSPSSSGGCYSSAKGGEEATNTETQERAAASPAAAPAKEEQVPPDATTDTPQQ